MKKLLIAAAMISTAIGGVAMAGQMQPRGLLRADSNDDGRISRDEMRAQADERFDRLDTNKDGFIDRSEMQASRDGERGARRGDTPQPPSADAVK